MLIEKNNTFLVHFIIVIGEVAEPKIRTILSSTTSLTNEFSGVFIYFLSNNMPWRDVSLVCANVPIIAAFIMSVVSFSHPIRIRIEFNENY